MATDRRRRRRRRGRRRILFSSLAERRAPARASAPAPAGAAADAEERGPELRRLRRGRAGAGLEARGGPPDGPRGKRVTQSIRVLLGLVLAQSGPRIRVVQGGIRVVPGWCRGWGQFRPGPVLATPGQTITNRFASWRGATAPDIEPASRLQARSGDEKLVIRGRAGAVRDAHHLND